LRKFSAVDNPVDNILGGMQKNADKVIHSLSTPLRKCRKQSYPQTYPHNINELTKRVWAGSLPPLYCIDNGLDRLITIQY